MSAHVKNIAIVGGTGQVGKKILDALLEAKKFNVSAISRANSSAAFPTGVTVHKGDYADDNFFTGALENQDVLIIVSSFQAPPDLQTRLISAAATVGVPWVIPNEFGSDNDNPIMRENVPVNAPKTQYRDQIEKLGKSSWIGIVNNPWFDYSLPGGWFGIDIKARTAVLYDSGTVKFNTTTTSTVGVAVANLLSLPVQPTTPGTPSLSDHKNKFVYICSFLTTQRAILTSVQKATHTTDADWRIEQKSAQGYLDDSLARLQNGDFWGGAGLLYGHHFKEGLGGNFQESRGTSNKVLSLPVEDLDNVVKTIVEEVGI